MVKDGIDWNIFVGVAIIAIIVIGAFALVNIKKTTTANQFFSAEDKLDKCKTPAGYTEQEWKEHMGHHPNIYKDCL